MGAGSGPQAATPMGGGSQGLFGRLQPEPCRRQQRLLGDAGLLRGTPVILDRRLGVRLHPGERAALTA